MDIPFAVHFIGTELGFELIVYGKSPPRATITSRATA